MGGLKYYVQEVDRSRGGEGGDRLDGQQYSKLGLRVDIREREREILR